MLSQRDKRTAPQDFCGAVLLSRIMHEVCMRSLFNYRALSVEENAVLLDEELTGADHLNSLYSLLSVVDTGGQRLRKSNCLNLLINHDLLDNQGLVICATLDLQ